MATLTLRPNGAGDYTEWSYVSSGNHWAAVDEDPANDSDYISTGETS